MEPCREDVDVNQMLKKTVELMENYARINNILILAETAKDLPIIAKDQSRLQQVFMNLLSNSIDATGEERFIRVRTECRDGWSQTSVTGSGPGMTEEEQRRVFEPFYTTKNAGEGTGLGLWVSYNIVEKMGGRISVQSRKNTGTVFTVEIPAVKPDKK
jgi:two-component system NtrC family sensor kinase